MKRIASMMLGIGLTFGAAAVFAHPAPAQDTASGEKRVGKAEKAKSKDEKAKAVKKTDAAKSADKAKSKDATKKTQKGKAGEPKAQ